MNKRRKYMLMGGWGGVGGLIYLLLDRFTTDASAPLTTPRTAEPGPGSWTVVQTNGNLSISSGQLTYPTPSPTGAWQSMGIVAVNGIARATGRALLATSRMSSSVSNNSGFGWHSSSALQSGGNFIHGMHTAGFPFENGNLAAATQIYIQALNTTYEIAVVLRSSGAFLLINDGSWQLWWVGHINTTATLYPAWQNSTQAGWLDNFRVVDLGGNFATDYGIATARNAVSSAGDVIATTADCIIEHTFTAATGVTKNILFRRIDDNNCWIARFDQTAGKVYLYEKSSGTETERGATGGVAMTQTNGTNYRAMITMTGTTIRVFANTATAVPGAAKIEYISASFQQTQTGAKVDHAGTDFVSWPRNPTMPNF